MQGRCQCGGEVLHGGVRKNPLEGPLYVPPEAPKEDPKDVYIRQLEQRVRELEARVSDYGWEASARRAAATGGIL